MQGLQLDNGDRNLLTEVLHYSDTTWPQRNRASWRRLARDGAKAQSDVAQMATLVHLADMAGIAKIIEEGDLDPAAFSGPHGEAAKGLLQRLEADKQAVADIEWQLAREFRHAAQKLFPLWSDTHDSPAHVSLERRCEEVFELDMSPKFKGSDCNPTPSTVPYLQKGLFKHDKPAIHERALWLAYGLLTSSNPQACRAEGRENVSWILAELREVCGIVHNHRKFDQQTRENLMREWLRWGVKVCVLGETL